MNTTELKIRTACEGMADALEGSRRTFQHYVELHRKKENDPSAYEKIKRNQEAADMCERALDGYASVKEKMFSMFQGKVKAWMLACFGPQITADVQERNHRFIEEALELVQACGATREECTMLVEYVYNRPLGEKFQEVGGVMVTLAALCHAQGLNLHDAADTELARIWTKIDKIREKQATKPKGSPLPEKAAS